MKKLIKTIKGSECTIYAVRHHNREKIAEAVPVVEVYEKITELPCFDFCSKNQNPEGIAKFSKETLQLLGKGSVCRRYYFSVVLCVGEELKDEVLDGLMTFELDMYLPRVRDGLLENVTLCAVSLADIEPERRTLQLTIMRVQRGLCAGMSEKFLNRCLTFRNEDGRI